MDLYTFDIPEANSKDLDENFYYADEILQRKPTSFELKHDFFSLNLCLGFPVLRVSSFACLSSSVILFATGNFAVFFNTVTNKQTIIRGLRTGGLTAVAAHPEGSYFAIGEKHSRGPNIYIYSYPDVKLRRILRHGAQISISHLSFSQDGNFLVSVASEPDFILSVWEWKLELANLRAKAFSQDVYRAAFSPLSDQILVSSGMGHIKFWKIASTFTGLKLQGTLGKFGATELTDIPCFVFLSSGKVVSGTETGNLLLWDGGFIKYEITNKQGKPCHAGSIDCCLIDNGFLITAGEDGYMRSWDLNLIDGPDTSLESESSNTSSQATGSVYVTTTPVLSLDATDSLLVVKNTKIKEIQRIPESTSEYIVVDAKGKLWKVNFKRRTISELISYHSQAVVSLDFSLRNHRLVTLGEDGSLRIYDPQKSHAMLNIHHANPGTVLRYLPSGLDALGCSFVAAFQDGSIRFFRHAESDVQDYLLTVRTHAFRPHDKPILDVAFAPNGSLFATATAEGHLFFFSIFEELPRDCPVFGQKTQVVPIGLLIQPLKLKSICWAPSNLCEETMDDKIFGALILGTCDGTLQILKFAFSNQYETDSNFLIPSSDYTIELWALENFTPIPQRTLTPSSAGSQPKPDAEKPAETAAPSTLSSEAEPKSQESETNENVECQTKYFYPQILNNDIFIVCIESTESQTEVRCCSFSNPAASKLLLCIASTVTAVRLSLSKKLLLVGCREGVVYALQNDFSLQLNSHTMDLPKEPYYWRMPMVLGPVISLASSFEDHFIAVAGMHGAIFSYKCSSNPWIKSEYPSNAPSSPPMEEASDLAHQYTIQESKRMTRLDLEKELSSKKRAQSVENFEQLRSEFERIYHKSKQLPEECSIPEKDLAIDPGLAESIEAETESKLQRVRNELLWDSEKISIALKKLKRRYFDPIQSDTFCVKGFNKNLVLYSFRTEKLNLTEAKIKSSHHSASIVPSAQANNEKARRGSKSKDLPHTNVAQAVVQPKTTQGKSTSVSRQEERRRNKLDRQEFWKNLLNSKPSPHSEDPQDVIAIRHAETNMGDYKLKMDKNYIVPENEQVNAEMKKKQIVLLQTSLINIMEGFNDKVRALRSRSEIIEGKLQEPSLPAESSSTFPNLEEPEHANRLPDNSIATQPAAPLPPTLGESIATETRSGSELAINSIPHVERGASLNSINQSSIMESSYFSKSSKLSNMEHPLHGEIEVFDRDLEALCQERLDVAIDVKAAEIRLLLLYKEWKLLKEFEKHDQVISEKLATKLSEKSEIDSKMEEIQNKINEQKTLIENAIDRRQGIETQMEQLLGEGNKHEDILKKIFRKKVKRKKRKETERDTQENSEEVDDDDSYESEESEESDESDESGEQVGDGCPPGCDPEVHQQVLALRELRLDIEDCLADVQKALDVYKKEFDLHSKKEKVIASGLKSTEQEIQEFQNQKQRKLNELYTMVPLALHQIHYLGDDFSEALVFPQDGLGKLQAKIKETEEQTQEVRKNHQQLKLEHVNLLSNRKEKKLKLKELSDKCVEVQMLKFGRCVDIEKLEKMGTNKAADELSQQILERDKKSQIEMKKMKMKIDQLRKEYTECIKKNTEKLEKICKLGESKKKLERYLDEKQDEVAMDSSGQGKLEVQLNEKHIAKVLRNQKLEITNLQSELYNLVRKPGPIPKFKTNSKEQ